MVKQINDSIRFYRVEQVNGVDQITLLANFHKSFINSYRGLDVVNCRRKLSKYYHKGMQDKIIRYLKSEGYISNYEDIFKSN